VRITLKQKSK